VRCEWKESSFGILLCRKWLLRHNEIAVADKRQKKRHRILLSQYCPDDRRTRYRNHGREAENSLAARYTLRMYLLHCVSPASCHQGSPKSSQEAVKSVAV